MANRYVRYVSKDSTMFILLHHLWFDLAHTRWWRSLGLRQRYVDSLSPAPLYFSYAMELHRIVLCLRLPSPLCSLIASLPWPYEQAWPVSFKARGRCEIAHKHLANLIPQPAGEVRRDGFVVRIIVEADGV